MPFRNVIQQISLEPEGKLHLHIELRPAIQGEMWLVEFRTEHS